MSLYVRLNAEYPTDDEFIEAGPLAELLYIRALCFCKRKLIDGTVSTKQLPTVAMGIPTPKKHAKTLVAVGLWEETSDGWAITGWLKWNKSAKEVQSDRETRRLASAKANHDQHHVGEGKKPSSRCEFCRDEFSEMRPITAPILEPPTDPDSLRSRLPKPKPEPEEEPKEKPEPEEEPSIGTSIASSSNRVAGGPRTTTGELDTGKLDTVLGLLADRQTANAGTTPVAPDRYRGTVINTLLRQHGDRIRRYVTDHPGLPAQACADALATEIA